MFAKASCSANVRWHPVTFPFPKFLTSVISANLGFTPNHTCPCNSNKICPVGTSRLSTRQYVAQSQIRCWKQTQVLTPVIAVLVSPASLAALWIPVFVTFWVILLTLPVALLRVVPLVASFNFNWICRDSSDKADAQKDIRELHDY